MKWNQLHSIFLIVTLGIAMSACSGLKSVPKGDWLYTGSTFKLTPDSLYTKKQQGNFATAMENLVVPKPNKKFLGMRPKLFFYNLGGNPEKEKGIGAWIRNKLGEKPVLISEVDRVYNEKLLINRLENNGFFRVIVNSDTTRNNKTAKINYAVELKKRFLIRDVIFEADSSQLWKDILETKPLTLLKSNSPYHLETIKNERVRIDEYLKNNGYYYFNPDYLLIQADSTVGKNQVDLKLKVKPSTPQIARDPYSINRIFVFSGYDVNSSRRFRQIIDTVPNYKNFIINDSDSLFRNKIYDRTLYFDKGDKYNRKDHNLSLNRLVNLGTFKFVKNQFYISDSTKHELDVVYMLTPANMKSIRLETTAKTNSASYTGFEVALNWKHKNFFRAAEQFNISIFGGMDFQLGGDNQGYDIYRFGAESSLVWPRIIAPFTFHTSSNFVPKTKLSLSYEFQKRMKLYALNSFTATFGYGWKENVLREHNLDIIEVNYIAPSTVTELFEQQAATNPYDARILSKQLTFGPTYNYIFTNTMLPNKRSTWYFKGSLDLSANLTGLIWGANVDKDNQKEILGVPFSQYYKIDTDVRFYHKLTSKTSIASRFMAGLAYPYGNSNEIPFVKQFFVGGTNSVRAFRARTVGPGSFDPRTSNTSFLLDQAGDIRLEANLEYRAKLFSILEGAVFFDAGNVWLINKNEARPGGEFSKDFLSEIAVGAGFGLRADVSILILRLDLAFPIRVPYYPKAERWTYDKVEFGDSQWRKDNLILNIAIGYPF